MYTLNIESEIFPDRNSSQEPDPHAPSPSFKEQVFLRVLYSGLCISFFYVKWGVFYCLFSLSLESQLSISSVVSCLCKHLLCAQLVPSLVTKSQGISLVLKRVEIFQIIYVVSIPDYKL